MASIRHGVEGAYRLVFSDPGHRRRLCRHAAAAQFAPRCPVAPNPPDPAYPGIFLCRDRGTPGRVHRQGGPAPLAVETRTEDTPNGGSWAGVLAAGIGCATIAALT